MQRQLLGTSGSKHLVDANSSKKLLTLLLTRQNLSVHVLFLVLNSGEGKHTGYFAKFGIQQACIGIKVL